LKGVSRGLEKGFKGASSEVRGLEEGLRRLQEGFKGA